MKSFGPDLLKRWAKTHGLRLRDWEIDAGDNPVYSFSTSPFPNSKSKKDLSWQMIVFMENFTYDILGPDSDQKVFETGRLMPVMETRKHSCPE